MTLWQSAGAAFLLTLGSFAVWTVGTQLFPMKNEPRIVDGIVVASIFSTLLFGFVTCALTVGATGWTIIRAVT